MVVEYERVIEYDKLIRNGDLLRVLDAQDLSVSELEALVTAQRHYNATLPGDKEIRQYLGGLSDGQVLAFAKELERRLRAETTVLDMLNSEGLDPFARDLRDTYVPFPVKYVSSEELQQMNRYPKRTNACYSGGTIFIAGELPGLRERLMIFATRGILSNDLFHEVYHGFQDAELRFESLEELLDYLARPHPAEWRVALAESHAWASCLPGFRDEVLIPVIAENYGIVERRYLSAAFETVRSLHALGLGDREIGLLVSKARWDENANGYKELESEVTRLASLRGHSSTELAEMVRKHKLRQRLQVLRGVGIAAELCQAN